MVGYHKGHAGLEAVELVFTEVVFNLPPTGQEGKHEAQYI